MDLLITIAIPTFNNAETLKFTVESCLNQSDLENVEILIVDNCSTDETRNFLRDLKGDNVRIIRNKCNVSLYANHNICLENASGDYIVFCHSDDILDRDAIKIIKDNLFTRNFPKKYIFWGHSLFRDYSTNLNLYNFTTGKTFSGERAIMPFLAGGLTPSGTCYSKDILDFGGFCDSDHRLATSDTSSMVYFALKGYRFEMMPDIIFHRTEAGTATGINQLSDWCDSYCAAFDYLWDRLSEGERKRLMRGANSFNYRPPLLFLYFCIKHDPALVAYSVLIHAALRPWMTMTKIFWRIISFAVLCCVKNLWRMIWNAGSRK
jgi:glycosyltransferase involved in cell wall biosynthesis